MDTSKFISPAVRERLTAWKELTETVTLAAHLGLSPMEDMTVAFSRIEREDGERRMLVIGQYGYPRITMGFLVLRVNKDGEIVLSLG